MSQHWDHERYGRPPFDLDTRPYFSRELTDVLRRFQDAAARCAVRVDLSDTPDLGVLIGRLADAAGQMADKIEIEMSAATKTAVRGFTGGGGI